MAYRGRVRKVSEDGKYGFIDIQTVTMEDGSPHDLATRHDLFIHSDVFRGWVSLEVGMEFMIYSVLPDDKRGEGFFKVVGARETEQSCLKRLSKGGIEINAQGLTGGRRLEHSSIFMSWCLSQALARNVKEQMVARNAVRLLIIQRPERGSWRGERRQLVELSAPMACLSFDAPGKHKVFALVVWAESEGDLKDAYLSRTDDQFKTDVISSDGTGVILEEKTRGFWASSPEIHWFGTGCIEVELPEEVFAKHPRDWKLVNRFFKTPPRDECRFRARRFFAYPIQPFWVVVLSVIVWVVFGLGWVFRLLVVAGLLLAGFRGVDYETLRHFKWYSLSSAWENLGNSVFVPRVKGRRVFVPIAVNPLFILAHGFLGMIWLRTFNDLALLYFVAGNILVSVALFAVLTLVMAWMDGVDWKAVEDRRREAERRVLEAEADLLVCVGAGPREPNIWQLPLGPKTIRFYAFAVKRYVCRNFAN